MSLSLFVRRLLMVSVAVCFVHVAIAQNIDVNGDGQYDCVDAEQIQFAIRDGNTDSRFDLNGDGEVAYEDLEAWLGGTRDSRIDSSDVDQWLRWAGSHDNQFVRGDTDLDGDIDPADLNSLALNWQQPGDYAWAGGDFDGNGVADSADLDQIGANWLHDEPARALASAASLSPVPEPHGYWCRLALIASFGGYVARRKH